MVLSDLFKQPYDHARWNEDQKILADRLDMENLLPDITANLRDFYSSNIASLVHVEYVLGHIKAYAEQHKIEIT